MIRRKAIVVLLALATACTIPQTSETREDSVAVLSEDTLLIEGTDQIPAVDTIFTNLNLEKKFNRSQIDNSVAYVYNYAGLDVFGTGDPETSIGHVDYKAKVKIIRRRDDGFVEIEFEGKSGDISSEDLLPVPVPETDDVTKYFLATLMLTEDPVERRSKDDDTDGSFSFIDYKFEGGFRVMTASQYESGNTSVDLPGFSVRQAFLLASYFYEDFSVFEEFPAKERDEDLPGEKHITVNVENGEVTVILVGNGDGCYWEYSVSGMEDGSGASMHSGGGC